VCAVLCAAAAMPVAVADAAFPGSNGRIAYRTYRPAAIEPYSFYSSRPDGTGHRRLVKSANTLNFSADGQRVVYTRTIPSVDRQAVGGGIGLARADGRDRTWLLRGGFQPATGGWWHVTWASFSPDGSKIAFSVTEIYPFPPAGERWERNVYVIGVDGTGLRLIARVADQPVFSPDGTRIAYIGIWSGGQSVQTVALDGSDRRTVVAKTATSRIEFAPDGRRLMLVPPFCDAPPRDCRYRRIAIVDMQTGERTRLPARVTGTVTDAVWSPNGRRIAYAAVAPGSSPYEPVREPKIFMIRPDGTGKRLAFTARVSTVDMLAWQPRP
jgi:dipeptidyl aminopeptidase/acylaminoacyl peptidase